jgi:VWFA-related protein
MKCPRLPGLVTKVYALAIVAAILPSILRAQSPTVSRTVFVTVTVEDDSGGVVFGIRPERFSVFEKDSQLAITSVDSLDKPASVVLLFDLSDSVPIAFQRLAAQGAYQFTRSSNKSNEYLVMAFAKETKLLSDWGASEQEVKNSLDNVTEPVARRIARSTALYDACSLALKKLESARYSKHVILLFSDGLDNTSQRTLRNFRDELKDSSASISAIDPIIASHGGGPLTLGGVKMLSMS